MKIIHILEDERFDPLLKENVQCTQCNHKYSTKIRQRDLQTDIRCENCKRVFTHFKYLF